MTDSRETAYPARLIALVRDALGEDRASALEAAERDARSAPEDRAAENRWLDAVGAAERDLARQGAAV
ncbi:MAG: hypothetical protein MUE51_11860 [Thermoleophilia bacterium]|jgi:hypothetical protein|nr:hypothetical protein [Thermoleophilia bacterium]